MNTIQPGVRDLSVREVILWNAFGLALLIVFLALLVQDQAFA